MRSTGYDISGFSRTIDLRAAPGPVVMCCHRAGNGLGDGYCFKSCNYGQYTAATPNKCGREDFACRPTQFWPDLGSACPACAAFDVCLAGTCSAVLNTCLPSCRGDFDCERGLHCDLSLDGGNCVPEARPGKAFGEVCEPSTTADPCAGFCLAAPESSKGYCSERCALGDLCAWNADAGRFGGYCDQPSTLIVDREPVSGDPGACSPSRGMVGSARIKCGTGRLCVGLDDTCVSGQQCFYSTY